MKEFSPEDLAKLTIFAELLDEVLDKYKHLLRHDFKRHYSLINNSVNVILRKSYGGQSYEELDEYRDKIHNFTQKLIEGKFHFKPEIND